MTSETRARVFIVEDHDIVRFGIEKLIDERFELVGSADNVTNAVELIRERIPDVVLLDVAIPGGGGALVVEALHRTHPDVKFLAFTVSTRREDVVRLMRAGASGYVVKTTDRHQLIAWIGEVLAGGIPISPEVAGYLLDIDDERHRDQTFGLLTPREREVATFIARGYTYREGAEAMEISVKTLETHIRHIFDKLGVTSRHELAEAAFGSGFVQPDRAASRLPTGTVTFLMTSIADLAPLWNRYPLQMPRVLARHDGLLTEFAEASHGSVVSSSGGALLAVFEGAAAAVTAAASAQRAVIAEKFGAVGHLRVRMVIVTGDADQKDGEYFGPVLAQGAALLKSCRPGQVLAAPATKEVVGDSLPTAMSWRPVNSDVEAFELVQRADL